MVRFHPDPLMPKAGETFFTSIGCMDGRVHDPIGHFGQRKFGAKYPDTVTEAGLVGLLAKENLEQALIASIKKKILISLEKHHSKGIIIHGHEECAGNQVDGNKHKDDIRKSVEVIKSFINPSVPVVGIFVKRSSQNPSKWEVEEV